MGTGSRLDFRRLPGPVFDPEQRLLIEPKRVGEHACLCTQKATMISHGIIVLPSNLAVSPG